MGRRPSDSAGSPELATGAEGTRRRRSSGSQRCLGTASVFPAGPESRLMSAGGSGCRSGRRYQPDERLPAALAFGLGLQIAVLTIAAIILVPTIVMRAVGASEAYPSWAVFALGFPRRLHRPTRTPFNSSPAGPACAQTALAGNGGCQVRQPWACTRPMRGRCRRRGPGGYASAGTQGASGVPPQ